MLILFVHRTCRPREPSRDPERRARRHARGVGRDPFVSRRSPLNETAVSLHTHESHTVLHTRCYTHHVTQNTRSTTLCYTMCSVAVCPEQLIHLLVHPDPLLMLVVAARHLSLAPPVFPFAPAYLLPRCLRFCSGVLRDLARHAVAHRPERGHPVLLWIVRHDSAVLRLQLADQLAASFLLPPLLFQRAARSRHARRGPAFSARLMGRRLRRVSRAPRLPLTPCLVVSEVRTSFPLPPCLCYAARLRARP